MDMAECRAMPEGESLHYLHITHRPMAEGESLRCGILYAGRWLRVNPSGVLLNYSAECDDYNAAQ